MKKNPSKSTRDKPVNISRVLEGLRMTDFKTTIANADYAHLLKRNWRDFDNGSRRAG